MMIDDAPLTELRALLALADLAVVECAACLSEAVELRDRIRTALAVRADAAPMPS